ncbi:MAG: hypothetical protein HQ453_09785, partial [Actinobacteria bacterium]|nr:hypothetical protein [Actinomycetota bacterium]
MREGLIFNKRGGARHATSGVSVRLVSACAITLTLIAIPASADAAEGTKTLKVGTLTLTACDSVEVDGSQAWCGQLPRPWDPATAGSATFDVGFVLTLPTGPARTAAAAPQSPATSA